MLRPGGVLQLMFKCGKCAIQNEFHLNEPTFEQLYDWISLKFCIRGQFEQSIVNKMDPSMEFEVYKQRRSFIFRLEQIIRKALRRNLEKVDIRQDSIRAQTEIFPLLPSRRKSCQQFLFVCYKSI